VLSALQFGQRIPGAEHGEALTQAIGAHRPAQGRSRRNSADTSPRLRRLRRQPEHRAHGADERLDVGLVLQRRQRPDLPGGGGRIEFPLPLT
jgi:hypothetical protein